MQAQRGTDKILREIKKGEDAKTTQRQADASRAEPEKMDGKAVAATVENMFNPEEEIAFAHPTPEALTEEDLEENEDRMAEEAAPDPTKLGGEP